MRKLLAYINDDLVGTLSESDDVWRFEYDQKWVVAPMGFDLSPALPRSRSVHEDGSSLRPVQWYFDNLLPEENLRDAISKEAQIHAADAFGLLTYLGAESAGSLVLLPPGQKGEARGGLRELSEAALCQRIENLARATLSNGAAKRMSVAGAQNKLLVVYRNGTLFEPEGAEPSTHILKPNHPGIDYPASVINEYLIMKLAHKLKLPVPEVHRKYTPEPVYIIKRFDRYRDAERHTQRIHIIDACQLMNKSRGFKYQAATLETLAQLVRLCRNRIRARLQLFSWLLFNLLVANHDNHLKNLSFLVSHEGIDLAPAYDLLSTGAYHTVALAQNRADWPAVPLAIALPDAASFDTVTRESVLRAGDQLALPRRIAAREIDRQVQALPGALDELMRQIEEENKLLGPAVQVYLAGELRLMRTIRHVIVPDMCGRVKSRI